MTGLSIAAAVFALALVAAGGVVWRIRRQVDAPPALNPRAFLDTGKPRGEGPLVVCAGDSITHGHASYPYVDLLRERLGGDGFTFVNAGVNGELSYNLVRTGISRRRLRT